VTRHGAGTWVADRSEVLPETAEAADAAGEVPDARRALAVAPGDALGYGDPRGLVVLREALAGYLTRARRVTVGPGRVIVCAGFTEALGLVAGVLRARGAPTLAIEIVRRARLAYRRRRDRLVAALARDIPAVEVSGIAAGLHALVHLPAATAEADVVARAATDHGLAVEGLGAFTEPGPRAGAGPRGRLRHPARPRLHRHPGPPHRHPRSRSGGAGRDLTLPRACRTIPSRSARRRCAPARSDIGSQKRK
jgi:DNA-binding transcriptional MocR family regulator